MKHTILALFLFCAACSAKPTVPERSLDQVPQGKATREGGTPDVMEFWMAAESGDGGLETLILAQSSISDCLREGVDVQDMGFQVQLKGRLNSKGRVHSVSVEGGNAATAACLKAVLGGLIVASHPASPFSLKITRGGVHPKGAKPFAVELKGPKKFE